MWQLTLVLVALQVSGGRAERATLAGSEVPLAADTVRLDIASAYERALAESRALQAATLRAEAANDRHVQAQAWPNPTLSVVAENLAQQERLTGTPGFEGTVGQAVFATALPFGPERRGRTGIAAAEARAAGAIARVVEQDVAVEILASLGGLLRDQALVDSAEEELQALTRFAQVLALQAEQGRASAGAAARAELARSLAATHVARREVALAVTSTDLMRRIRIDPATHVHLDVPVCAAGPTPLQSPAETPSPELEVATARVDAASSAVTLTRGLRIPDLHPQVGVRREAGLSALYLGVSTPLPLFDRGSRELAASRADERAATAEASEVEARVAARREAAHRSLAALERAGRSFSERWFAALERTVTAAQTRFDLGEGTMLEFLDSRRARLQALDDYTIWQAEWWNAQAAVVRADGSTPDATILCTDPFRQVEA